MGQLALALLGPLRATLDGVPITGFESQKVRALLAYLAIEADCPQGRDVLAYFEVVTTVRWLLNVMHAVESQAMPPAALADFRRFLVEPVRHAEAFLHERTGVAVAIPL